jgi:hypothetical protein
MPSARSKKGDGPVRGPSPSLWEETSGLAAEAEKFKEKDST